MDHLYQRDGIYRDQHGRDYLDNLKAVGGAYRETIGRHFPAMTAVEVSALMEDRAKVEIQAVAVVPDP